MKLQREISKDILSCILITILMFTTAMLLPILGSLITIFAPLPILFYRSKLGRKYSILTFLFALAIIIIISAKISIDIMIFSNFMFIGFIIGEIFEKKFSIEKTVLITSTIVIAYGVICLSFCSSYLQIDIYNLIFKYIHKTVEIYAAVYKELKISHKDIDKITYAIICILPSLITTTTLLIIWINTITAKPIMEKYNVHYPDFGKLNLWHTPEYLIWCLITLAIITLVGENNIKFVGINGLIIVLLLYFFQGIAIMSFFLKEKKVPIIARTTIYVIIGLIQFFFVILIFFGIFDVWFNFRKIKQ